MIVLDASVLIALGNAKDAHHSRAGSIFAKHLGSRFLIHPLTKAEVLVGPVKRGIGEQKERELTAMGVEEWVPAEGSGLRLAQLRATTGLTMPDCCVLDAAIATGSRIATFDAALSREAVSQGVSVLPS